MTTSADATTAKQLDGAATIFVVRHVMSAVAHYNDVLGFRTAFTYGEPTFYAGVERDEVIVHLQSAAHTKRQPGHGAIYIFCADVGALYDQIRTRGGNVPKGPNDYAYGMRDFDAYDLDGNQLSFGSETKR